MNIQTSFWENIKYHLSGLKKRNSVDVASGENNAVFYLDVVGNCGRHLICEFVFDP